MAVHPYTLTVDGGDILAAAPEKVARLLLLIPAARLNGWHVRLPATRENFLAAEAVGAPAEVTSAYRAAQSQALQAPWPDMVALASRLIERDRTGAMKRLMLHQWQFLAHSYGRQGVLNASEQGTGKTRSAWALAHLWGCQRVLIVCPKSLVLQWRHEFNAMWAAAPTWNLVPLVGPLRERRDFILHQARETAVLPMALITNYEALEDLKRPLLAWQPDLIIMDESWRLKNPAAQVTKAALALSESVHTRAGRVVLLTGTPIGNHVGDLYTQIKMVAPSLVPEGKKGYSTFLHRYAQMVLTHSRGFPEWKAVGCIDPAGLLRQIAPVWFRATKAACLELPPKQHRRVVLPLPPATMKLYRQVAKDGASALGAPLCLDGELQTMLYLQRLAGGFRPRALDEWGREWERTPLPCPKLAWLRDWALDTLAGNPTARAIVWCRFLTEIGRVQAELQGILGRERVRCAHGAVVDDALEEIKREFNARGEDGCQVLVAQWTKMAFGHNLQACDTNIFFSHTWSYVERAQAEDRSHRHGRADAVEYVELVARDTIDEEIMRAMDRKGDLALRLAPATVSRKAVNHAP